MNFIKIKFVLNKLPLWIGLLGIFSITSVAEGFVRIEPQRGSGIVQSLDVEKRTLTIQTEMQETVAYTWDSWTKFYKDKEKVDPKQLKAGVFVEYSYRLPLLTDPYLVEISWQSEDPSASIRYKIISGRTAEVLSVRARSNEEGTLISGRLRRTLSYSVPHGAHLHLIALNKDGAEIETKVSKINRNLFEQGRGNIKNVFYGEQIDAAIKQIAEIRVKYVGYPHDECSAQFGRTSKTHGV